MGATTQDNAASQPLYASLKQVPVNHEAASQQKAVIQLVDDSPTIRAFVKFSLQAGLPNVEISESQDGREALYTLARRSAKLIICDLNMPGMSGWTFLRILRSNPILAKKPVLVLSSEPLDALEPQWLNDKNLRFLRKPASSESIVSTAKHLLGL